MLIVEIIFWISALLIFHAMISYPLSLKLIDKFIKKKNVTVIADYKPKVSIIIPAHNEEDVIVDKMDNLINLNYPKELTEIIIASDNSNDNTNELVKGFIQSHPKETVTLYDVKERKGKTNAQNEAVRIANGELLVFSDANSILHKEVLNQLASSFIDKDVIYVAGKLQYVNDLNSITSNVESIYWNYDLFMRKVESQIKTITAGNGAIYAIKKSEYIDFDPIRSHDSAMPEYAAINHKKALFNTNAIAYEKAGESADDEFKRKVRMFRGGLKGLFKDIRKYNPFIYGWYSYFYFGHRACRRGLFLLHIILLLSNIHLATDSHFYLLALMIQSVFYLLASMKKLFNLNNKLFYFPYYYTLTLVAQLIGTYNNITGKSKPFWEKAESTR